MASGKYSRVDGRKSSGWCSTVSVVVLVGVVLVGVWMLMSSSVDPIQNSDLASEDTRTEIKQKLNEHISSQFKDSSGDLPDDAVKEDKFLKESTEEKTESEEEPKVESENDGDGKREDGESNSGDSDSNSSAEGSESGYRDSTKESEETNSDGETNTNEPTESEDSPSENKDEGEKRSTEENVEETKLEEKVDSQNEETSSDEKKEDQGSIEGFPAGAQSEILNETTTQSGAWSTQAAESESEKKSQGSLLSKDDKGLKWKVCNVTAGPDYIPCLDNIQAIRKLRHTTHYEHRERHCPDEAPTCLVPLPEGYKQPVRWPRSREQIWYSNVPHTKLADVKGHQNWVKVSGDHLTFPGGGTQFKHGALHYIDFIQKSLPDIAWGNKTRVILDVGCGVASFGGYLFDRDVLAMSLAPKDEHEAQVQFALERGIPAISAVMGTKRLPYPSKVFDVVHCARCRVPWHIEGGKLLLELNRVLRPGGYFVWSATPVYQNLPEDVGIWKAMSELTKSMCWNLLVVQNDKLNGVGVAIYRKPTSNQCYEGRQKNEPPLCEDSEDADAVWYCFLQPILYFSGICN